MTNRERFRADAVEILRREVPDDLEWVFQEGLPPLAWRDGTAVDEVIPRGFLVMAAARGEPEPDAEMRRRGALFDRDASTAFAGWLLRAWIEHDVAVPELDAAREAELRALAERAAGLARRLGRGGTDPEERFRQLLAQEKNRPEPSSLPHRGLLAAVAALVPADAGAGAVEPIATDVERYLETRRHERPEQCRALRAMLSSIRAR